MTYLRGAVVALASAFAIFAAHDVYGRQADPELPMYLRANADGFVVLYHPSLGDRVRHEVDRLPELRRELEAQLGTPVLTNVELEVTLGSHLAPDDELRTQIILPNGQAHDSDAVRERIRFELARRAMNEASGGRAPAWFVGAFALRFSRGMSLSNVGSMVELTLRDEVPPLAALADLETERCVSDCLAEAEAATDFVRFLSTREEALANVMTSLRSGDSGLEQAISDATKIPAEGLNEAWHRESSGRHWLIAAVTAFAIGLVVWWLARRFKRALKNRPTRQGLAARRRRKPRVLARPSATEEATLIPGRVEVPRIEHDGSWHTLH